MGFSIGSNNELLTSISVVGVKATVMVSLVVLFSVIFVKVSREAVKLK